MDRTYWHKQVSERPLYADLLWSRPENKYQAGKLLIVGGNANSFTAPAAAYEETVKAGVGVCRVLLPDHLQKTVGKLFPETDFAPSTPSGSFSQKALPDLLELGEWADGVMLAGDLGRNSETAILLEYFAEKYADRLTITKDAADYFLSLPGALLARPNTLLVISFEQLQKLGHGAHFAQAFTSDMGLLRLVDSLHEFTSRYEPKIITRLGESLVASTSGEVSSTSIHEEIQTWRLVAAALASVWWLQNPQKDFEALTTANFLTSGTAGRT